MEYVFYTACCKRAENHSHRILLAEVGTVPKNYSSKSNRLNSYLSKSKKVLDKKTTQVVSY